jgi:hypothetical protein
MSWRASVIGRLLADPSVGSGRRGGGVMARTRWFRSGSTYRRRCSPPMWMTGSPAGPRPAPTLGWLRARRCLRARLVSLGTAVTGGSPRPGSTSAPPEPGKADGSPSTSCRTCCARSSGTTLDDPWVLRMNSMNAVVRGARTGMRARLMMKNSRPRRAASERCKNGGEEVGASLPASRTGHALRRCRRFGSGGHGGPLEGGCCGPVHGVRRTGAWERRPAGQRGGGQVGALLPKPCSCALGSGRGNRAQGRGQLRDAGGRGGVELGDRPRVGRRGKPTAALTALTPWIRGRAGDSRAEQRLRSLGRSPTKSRKLRSFSES